MVTVLDIGEPAIPPALYRVPDAVRVLGLSRSVVYDLIRVGRLRTVKEGRTRLVAGFRHC